MEGRLPGDKETVVRLRDCLCVEEGREGWILEGGGGGVELFDGGFEFSKVWEFQVDFGGLIYNRDVYENAGVFQSYFDSGFGGLFEA